MQLICKYYTISYKGLDHLWIRISGGGGVLEPISLGYQEMAISNIFKSTNILLSETNYNFQKK